MLCLYMHSERQHLISRPSSYEDFTNVVDEKHSMHYQQTDTSITSCNKDMSFDPFTHAGTMMHQQVNFKWNIFDNSLVRTLCNMTSVITSNLPQDPRAKKSSIITFNTSTNTKTKTTALNPIISISSNNNNNSNKRAMVPLQQRLRHECWQPITNETPSEQQHNKKNYTSLPAWMFTHKHVRDVRSNSDGLRKLTVKVEMVRHKKITLGQVKKEQKRYLSSRTDDFIPCKKSSLSYQCF